MHPKTTSKNPVNAFTTHLKPKVSLAATALSLVLFFPTAAAPLCPEKVQPPATEQSCSDMPFAGLHEGYIPSASEWRRFDINGDNKFDKNDINELIERGWQVVDFDLNGDGKKDIDDILAMFLQLSIMDRSCNQIVNDEDYTYIEPVELPAVPDVTLIRSIVSKTVVFAWAKLPSDIEEQAFSSVPAGEILSLSDRAFVYQVAGLSGLAQMNLDAAKWGFGRAFQTDERTDGAIGSLAFCMAAENKDNEALLLLSYARDQFPESAPTSTSLGWVFARHGQNEEALEYFREAVFFTPEIAQYHMNLGIILMRMGMKQEAFEAFSKAVELDTEDARKFLFWYTTKPPDAPPKKKTLDPEEFIKAREIEIREMEELGHSGDELPIPWKQMSPCDQAKTIPEILDRKYGDRMEEIAQDYANDAARRIEGITEKFWPNWSNVNEDWDRYVEGVEVLARVGATIINGAEKRAGGVVASLTRNMGTELLGYSSFFMESALQQASFNANEEVKRYQNAPLTAQSVIKLKAEAYNDALENAIKDCYKDQIDIAYRWISVKSTPYRLPNPTVETPKSDGFMYLFMVIPLKCFEIEGYCPDGEGDGMEQPEPPFDLTLGFDFGIVSFEWNPRTNEFELNLGQGFMVGVTWKPETGFGAQLGLGLRGNYGVVGANAVVWVRIDEGILTAESEFDVHLGLKYDKKGTISAGVEVKSIIATASL